VRTCLRSITFLCCLPVVGNLFGQQQTKQISDSLKAAIDAVSQWQHTNFAEAPIQITGSYKGPGGWSRNMQSTMHCGNSPESWVRGSVVHFDASGHMTLTVELETDSASAGPKGRVSVTLKNAAGKTSATAASDEIGTGGKDGGHAAIRNFSSSVLVPAGVAGQTRSLYVDAECTGSINRILNVSVDDVLNAFKIGIAVAAAI